MNKYLIFTSIIIGIVLIISFIIIFNSYNKKNILNNDVKENDFQLKNEILYNTDLDNHKNMEEYYQKGIYKSTYKIIVLGDVHGDLEATIRALKKGRVIDDTLNWCGGKTHVVQMGDIVDRKIRGNCLKDEDSEFKIIELFLKLMKQAYESGGGFHCILGNHELMNVTGDLSYVSDMGLKHFIDGANGRRKYFERGGPMCQVFSKYWNPVIKIGKYMFCHGSVSYDIGTKYNIIEINDYMRRMLMNELKPGEEIIVYNLFFDGKSILWNREFSEDYFDNVKVKEMLGNHKCEYMVVGHTIQMQGINMKKSCIWFVDTGMSEAFGKRENDNRIQVLEILRNGKSVDILV